MPDFDLSAMSPAELRGLLDSARQRGQAAQAYRILQEMAARREGQAIAGEPRTIRLDLSDPLERHDELEDDLPPWSPAAAAAAQAASHPAAPEPEPEPMAEPDPDGGLSAELATAIRDLRPPSRSARKAARRTAGKGAGKTAAKAARSKPPAKPRRPRKARPEREPSWDEAARQPRPPRRKPRPWSMALFGGGAVLGIVLGAGLARETLLAPAASGLAVFPEAPTLKIETAEAPAPTPPPPVVPPPAELAAAEETVGPPPAAETGDTAPAVDLAEAEPPAAEAPAAELSVPVKPAADKPAADKPAVQKVVDKPAAEPAESAACGAAPADRVICRDDRLQRLQKDLRAAYAEALDAHADRATLRQRQLAWASERDGVTDPAHLARLYEARIRKLQAAAAEARKAREG